MLVFVSRFASKLKIKGQILTTPGIKGKMCELDFGEDFTLRVYSTFSLQIQQLVLGFCLLAQGQKEQFIYAYDTFWGSLVLKYSISGHFSHEN